MRAERKFKCLKCGDTKTRAYFSTSKNVGWCHNCSSVITKEMYEKWFNTKLEDIEITFDEDEYLTDEEIAILESNIPKAQYLTKELSTQARNYLLKRLPIKDEIKRLNLKIPKWEEFISLDYDGRIKFNCIDRNSSKIFWLARSYYSDSFLKVKFPKSDEIGVGKSEVVYLNEFYLENIEFFKELAKTRKLVPVICEGEFDALSVLYIDNEYVAVGVGILGKNLSSNQLIIIKELFPSWSEDSEVWLCLDGDEKSAKEDERMRMKLYKSKTIERLDCHFSKIRIIELGEDDPNSIFMREKNFNWMQKYIAT